jgi:predicted nucleotidyltransferase
MNLAELQQKTSQIFRTNGVSRASVFGSVSRGTENTKSDVDLLVRFKKPIGMIAYMRFIEQLKSSLERDVDVITEDGINPRLKPHIIQDIKLIYEG